MDQYLDVVSQEMSKGERITRGLLLVMQTWVWLAFLICGACCDCSGIAAWDLSFRAAWFLRVISTGSLVLLGN